MNTPMAAAMMGSQSEIIRHLLGQFPTPNAQLPRRIDSKACSEVGSWKLGVGSWALSSSEFLLQYRARGRPSQLSVVLRRAIRIAVLVTVFVVAVVDAPHVVETERLVGELVDGGPADAASDAVDDLLPRG